MNKRKLLLYPLMIPAILLSACPPHEDTSKGYTVLENWVTEHDCNKMRLKSSSYENILVIPVQFEEETRTGAKYSNPFYFKDFDQTELDYLNNYYFGEEDSVTSYFKNASHSKKEFRGTVAPVYHETSTTISSLESNTYVNGLFKFLNKVVMETQKVMGDDFVREYDKNGDGFIDCVNFISNYRPGGADSLLWPHNYWTKGDKNEGYESVFNYVFANTYPLTKSNKTIIHELSHMFGVIDYYNYSASSVDYIGQFDLQGYTYGDWNAFSKFSVGWGTPYVVDGSNKDFTISIGSSQETGEYIIVPAKYDKYNKTPFDEYFIIELLSETKNNKTDIEFFEYDQGVQWKQRYGVRISHVDAGKSLIDETQYNYGGFYQQKDLKTEKDFEDAAKYIEENGFENNRIMFNNNNCSTTSSHEYVIGYDKNPLLSVIQKGGINTFGKNGSSYRHALTSSDLFVTGSVFDFDAYSTFLSKNGTPTTIMNNGDVFPYQILFDEVTSSNAKITIKKVK